MIDNLEWDSFFFSRNVGKLNIPGGESFDYNQFLIHADKFDLVYIFSDHSVSDLPNIRLVDKKVTFVKALQPTLDYTGFKNTISSHFKGNTSINEQELLNLARLAGKHSRFNSDPDIGDVFFGKLYSTWLKRSLAFEICDTFGLATVNDKITGFVTCSHNKDNSKIGLISVDPDYQGRKIGSDLLKFCEIKAIESGSSSISVVTQLFNTSACRLYTSNGYKQDNVQWVYHFHNKTIA